ncbi:MAG: hypothetical protein ACTS5Y_12465 [Pollutimonas bauzanensis]
MATVTIDGKEYDSDQLSEATRTQLMNLSFVDAELRRLQAQAAVLETARQVYGRALRDSLDAPATN